MKPSYDFYSGDIAERIIDAIYGLSHGAVKDLERKGYLLFRLADAQTLSSRSLRYHAISEYVKVTGRPACYFFFGSEEPVTPCYTQHDAEVIRLINQIPEEKMGIITRRLFDFFPNDTFTFDGAHVNSRLRKCLSRMGGALNILRMDPWKTYHTDAASELERYKNAHLSKTFLFDTEIIPDIATHCGVSLHWLFALSVPLFCKSQEADNLFDYYTLLFPDEQKAFLDCLRYGLREEE